MDLATTAGYAISQPVKSMSQPKVIFLDAVGTLFGVKESVGQVYHDLAREVGVVASVEALDRAFYKSFKAATSMAFPDAPKTDIPHLEFLWWQKIAVQTFERAQVLEQFEDFESFFETVYQHFATAVPWVVYEDTAAALERWKKKGIELGIISNFDSRIYTVLESLGFQDAFDTITISTEVGAAKPDSRVFETALHKHDCLAAQAWHVGDSYTEDVRGAEAAGMKGIWLKRSGV